MMNERTELKHRIKAKRKELEARVEEAKAEVGAAANDEVDRLQDRLTELKGLLQDGWEDLSEATAAKLNEWLRDN